MASKMAAKEERLYKGFFSYINISLRFLCVKFVLIAMSVCFLYIICNFEIFLTVDSSMASKITAKMENSIYW